MGLDDFGAEKLSGRPLEFIWILDVSGSMSGARINALNFAIREVIPAMVDVASSNTQAQIMVRAMTFGTTIKWHIAERTPIEDLVWEDVHVEGCTNLGLAFEELAKVLDTENMPARGLPPVLVLVSDGRPTDAYKTKLKALLAKPWGMKAVKLAISVGDDDNFEVLKEFCGDGIAPLKAESANQLIEFIKFASTEVLKAASATPSMNKDSEEGANVVLPEPPQTIVITDPSEIF